MPSRSSSTFKTTAAIGKKNTLTGIAVIRVVIYIYICMYDGKNRHDAGVVGIVRVVVFMCQVYHTYIVLTAVYMVLTPCFFTDRASRGYIRNTQRGTKLSSSTMILDI